MNDFGVLFIRQARHQNLRIVEFVLKKLKTNNLSEREFEGRKSIYLNIIHSPALFEEHFPRSVISSSLVTTISTYYKNLRKVAKIKTSPLRDAPTVMTKGELKFLQGIVFASLNPILKERGYWIPFSFG